MIFEKNNHVKFDPLWNLFVNFANIPNFSSKILDIPRKGLHTTVKPKCLGKIFKIRKWTKTSEPTFTLKKLHFTSYIAPILYITHQQKSVLNYQSPTYAIFCFIRHSDGSFLFINQTSESYTLNSNQFCSNKGFAQAQSTTHIISLVS